MSGYEVILAIILLLVSAAGAGSIGWATYRGGGDKKPSLLLVAGLVTVAGVALGYIGVEVASYIGKNR